MIGSLRGMVTERDRAQRLAVELVVDVGGRRLPGRRPGTRAGRLGEPAARRLPAVHTHVREGAITLYGFARPRSGGCFELLLGAHGVGPGLALAILGVHAPAALAQVVASGDVDALNLVPGVGQKTAPRLHRSSCRPRFDYLGARRLRGRPPGARRRARRARAEVGEALAAARLRARRGGAALRRLPGEGTVEELLRQALRKPGAARGRPRRARRARGHRRRAATDRPSTARAGARPAAGAEPSPSESARGRAAPPAARRFRRAGAAEGAPRDRPRGGTPARRSPSTTCSSPGRRGSARRRWPASSPPRWGPACG